MKTISIIPAGGKGFRSGNAVPKQYLKIKEKELVVYTLEVFQKNEMVDEIIISAEPEYFKLLNKLKENYNLTKITIIVESGKTRQASVFNGINAAADAANNDLIVVHDAARPLLPQSVLTNAIKTAGVKGNALVCLKARDTLIKGKAVVENYIDRDEIFYVQTPQIFPYSVMLKAMQNAIKNNFTGTDESMLVRQLGEKVNIVDGSVYNFKITTADDIEMFESLIAATH
jgi:2-C-methyl-D-erythritol 4-phosphate cytidylyltransferase